MFVLHEVLGLSEDKMIVPVDEKRGKLLLSGILNGGNFGQHFTKYGHFTQQGMAKKYFLKIWRNMHFVRYYPAEALCEPIFRTWFFCGGCEIRDISYIIKEKINYHDIRCS